MSFKITLRNDNVEQTGQKGRATMWFLSRDVPGFCATVAKELGIISKICLYNMFILVMQFTLLLYCNNKGYSNSCAHFDCRLSKMSSSQNPTYSGAFVKEGGAKVLPSFCMGCRVYRNSYICIMQVQCL